MKKTCVLCAALLAAMSVSAAAETLAETLARFEKMGMPNVAGAEFANIRSSQNFTVFNLGVCGNAWMLSDETAPDGVRVATFVINGAETVRAAERAEKNSWDGYDVASFASWEKVRLQRATAQLSQRLENPKATVKNPGYAFLFALQLHRHGETALAEALARNLAETYGADDPDLFAREALCESLYKTACHEFRELGDSQRFSAELRRIAEQSPEAWSWRPVLREMLEHADVLALRGGGADLLPQGYEFSDKERDLALRLGALPEFVERYENYIRSSAIGNESGIPWLAPVAWTNRVPLLPRTEYEIRAMGIAALPMLIALCGDSPVNDAHDTFPYPATRAEKAMRILRDILPLSVQKDENAAWFVKNTRQIKDIATEFYEQHKDDSPEVLALAYVLNFNFYFNRNNALGFLRRQAHVKRIPELEIFLAEEASDFGAAEKDSSRRRLRTENMAKFALYYAACRNDDAFREDIAERLVRGAHSQAEIAASASPDDERVREAAIRERDEICKIAENLRAVSLAASDAELLAAPDDGGGSYGGRINEYANTILSARLNAMPFKDAYLAVLKQADPENIDVYVVLLNQRIHYEGDIDEVRNLVSATDGSEYWRNILENETGDWRSGLYLHMRLFDHEVLAKTVSLYGYSLLDCDEAEYASLLKRQLARLDGITEESLPISALESSQLSAARRDEIAGRFASVETRREAQAVFDALPVGEQDAAAGVFASHPELARKLALLSREITALTNMFEGADASAEIPAACAVRVGERMSADIAAELRRFCEAQMRKDIPTVCTAERKPGFGGWVITVRPFAEEEYYAPAPKGADADSLTKKIYCVGYTGLACETARVETFSYAFDRENPDSAPSRSRYFETASEEIISNPRNPSAPAFIHFATKGKMKYEN